MLWVDIYFEMVIQEITLVYLYQLLKQRGYFYKVD